MVQAIAPVAKKKPVLTAFGRKLKDLRTAAGLTQAELAERVGLHPVTVSRLEGGALDPTWTNIVKLAAALGVTPDAFQGSGVTEEDPPADDPPPRRFTGKRK